MRLSLCALFYFLLYIERAISKPNMILQFYDQLGLITDNPMKENFFTLVAVKGTRRFILRARSHDYHSNLKMFSDPCTYKLSGFFSYNSGSIDFCNFKLKFLWGEYIYKVNFSELAKKKNFSYSRDLRVPYERVNKFKIKKYLLTVYANNSLPLEKNNEKYSETNMFGELSDIDSPFDDELYLEYSSILDGTNFKASAESFKSITNGLKSNPSNEDQKSTMKSRKPSTTSKQEPNFKDENVENTADKNKTQDILNFPNSEKNMKNMALENQGIDKKDASDKDYLIRIFIFNDAARVKQLGLDINKNTMGIFKDIEGLYKKTIIQPVLNGILNLTEKIQVKNNMLESFKDFIDPLRFSPFNLKTPLYKSDLIILLSGDALSDGTSVYQGMSFYGGSNRLDSSYSVVSTSSMPDHSKTGELVPNSDYFIAKKVAHEIAHSLGVIHDKFKGYLMEPSTCKDCNELKREFSKQSIDQMSEFVLYNKKIFAKKPVYKYSSSHTIKSLTDASEYASERRKHSFMDIVKTRLKGQIPIRVEMNTYLSVCFFIYGVVIYLIIRYYK